MKTLRIALVFALVTLSFNAFSETCNPCITSGNLLEDSVILYDQSGSHDSMVNEMLQQMTVTVREQMLNTSTAFESKKQKHSRRKSQS